MQPKYAHITLTAKYLLRVTLLRYILYIYSLKYYCAFVYNVPTVVQ